MATSGDTEEFDSETERRLKAAAIAASSVFDRQVVAQLLPQNAPAREAFQAVLDRMHEDADFATHSRRFLSPTRGCYEVNLTHNVLRDARGWVAGTDETRVDFVLGLPQHRSQHGLSSRHFQFTFHKETRPLYVRAVVGRKITVGGQYNIDGLLPFPLAKEQCTIDVGSLRYTFRYHPDLTEEQQVTLLQQYWKKRDWPEPDVPTALASASGSGFRTVQGHSIGKEVFKGTFGAVAFGVWLGAGGQHVACKQIKPKYYRAQLILNEIRALQLLDHPNIVKFADNFLPPTDEEVHSATELDLLLVPVMVGTLERTMEQSVSLVAEQKVRLAVDIFCALSYLHQNGWMHQDIKPRNIGIAGTHMRAVVLDLGSCVKAIHSNNHCAGTITYLAPEILDIKGSLPAKSRSFGPSVDDWAAALSIIECLILRRQLSREWQDKGINKNAYDVIRQALDAILSSTSDSMLRDLLHVVQEMFQWALRSAFPPPMQ